MSDKHSELLSPSGSGLWLICTAMPGEKKARGIQSISNKAADRGTLQHDFAEQLSTGKINPDDFAQYTTTDEDDPTKLTIAEWVDVRTAVAAISTLMASYPTTKFKDYYELSVGFKDWRSDCFGTLDRGRLDITNKTLFVLDYKFGRGLVSAKNNSQLRVYALALLDILREKIPNIDTLVETVVLGIAQPKVKFQADTEVISLADLKQWDKDVLQPAQHAILDGTGAFLPGAHCKAKYCNVREVCRAFAGEASNAMDDFMQEYHDVGGSGTTAPDLPDDMLQDRLDKIPLIEAYIEMLQAQAEARIRDGVNLERYKIVNGKGKVIWTGVEEDTLKTLKSLKLKAAEMHKKVLVTPAQVKTLLEAQSRLDNVALDKIEAATKYQPGSEKLVPADEKGEALVFGPSSEDEMADLLGDILGDDPLDNLEFRSSDDGLTDLCGEDFGDFLADL